MQLRYWKNVNPAVDGMQKIAALSWASNGKKLAVATSDRIIHLFDESGERKERFPTKPSDKGQKSYVIRGLEFSPDCTKIAIAQSDNIVFVYKVGVEWGEKKSICNKFPTSSSVTCMTWPREHHGEVIFGLAEGKVRIGFLKNNKANVLYSTDSYVVALASSRDGHSIVSGHLDGSIYTYNLETQAGQKVINYSSVPYGLAWGESIVCAGIDGKVAFYDARGNLFQKFDYTNDDKVKDFTQAASNPSGETIVLGNFNRFYIYNYNSRRGQWEEIGVKNIENYYSVTAITWKQDGSKLVTGSLCGSVDLFDASMKKIKYKGKFEFNYVAPNQVIVKTLSDGSRCVVKTKYAPEISKINIYQDRYVVANTYDSLLLGDLTTAKISEVQWKGSGNEKYDFSNPNVCMIINAGELLLVEYGNDEILGTARTEYTKPHLISARLSYVPNAQGENPKMMAYLLDNQTITIQDLNTSSFVATISHDQKIDFLELNSHANKLLFRDKRKQLYLYNIKDQVKNTLLSYCNYAQWVPNSEVVVAQNRNNLCVWYSIENPDKVAIYSIKGDVESIERTEGKTEVIVSDNGSTAAYTLDEPLIEFGFAIESRDLLKAMEILDPLEMSPETEANWRTLAKVALEEQNVVVAERCYSALGDVARATYLHKIIKMMDNFKKQTGNENGLEYYKAQAHLAILDKQLYKAETIFLNQNEDEEAMEMYQELHKWTESIKIAEKRNHPDVKDFKVNYFKWLLDTNQEGKAAEMKENEGDYGGAINLYLKGGLPAKAAGIVSNYTMDYPQDLLDKIATALTQSGMYEKAGEFYERLDLLQKALNAFCEGNAYRKAVDLAKRAAPGLVVQLEEKWGDWLVSQRQTENAINHYKEAGAFQKAVEAAVQARQWNMAIQLLHNQPPEVSRPFYKHIAKHYADVKQYDLAEKYYVKAGAPVEAFELYIRANKWELAFKVAKENLPDNEIVQLYARVGQKLAEEGHYKEAERLFMEIQEPDLAINMYKKAGQYDNMIRLVAKYRKNLLRDTHLSIAQKLERDGNFKQAEHHYIESGAWNGAVEMYKNNALWEDAIRVCRINGTDKETSELAKRWAESLGPDVGMKMLLKLNLVDAVIEYLTDRNEFQEAFKMAQQNAKHKIRDVHLKYALFLEDEKRYKDAEDEFIKAGKPGEAVSMYEHQGDWHSALQVARQYDPQSVPGILLNQARFFLERRDFAKAEQCYIQAKKPDLAIRMYTELQQHTEALRVARKHAPNLVEKINRNAVGQNQEALSGDQLLQSAKIWEESRDWGRAIDTYLEVRREHFDDPNLLREAWERAVQIARIHDKGRLQEVVIIVSKRLWDIQQYEAAAEQYEDIGMYEEAVDCLLDGAPSDPRLFDRAKGCVAQIRDPNMAGRLNDKILNRERSTGIQKGDINTMVNTGEVDKAIGLLIEQGKWPQALELANSNKVLTKYLMRYAKVMMESGRFGETIAAFAKYGLPLNPNFYAAYKTLILEIFAECDPNEIKDLRKALYDFVTTLEDQGEANTPAGKEFMKYLTAAHLVNLRPVLEKKGLKNIVSKLVISLLRYSDFIRTDKLYYDAGMAAKSQNKVSTAFLILNRYLDIYEAIQESEGNNLEENPDFAITDFPSLFDIPLSEKNLISEDDKQKISDWLVEVSMKHKTAHSFDLRTCDVCKNKVAENAATCPKCKTQSPIDIITGYPVAKNEMVPCDSCKKPSTKENWQEYLQNFANCPWCNNLPS